MSGILKFLGTDAGFGKSNTSAFIIHNQNFILIDCGYTVFPKLLDYNLLDKNYNYDVICTHTHPDHFGSLGQLAFYSYYIFLKPINIISECQTLDSAMTDTGAGKDFCDPDLKYPRFLYSTNNNYNLKFIKTKHARNLDCYGFFLQIDDKKIVYTGDTSTIEPFLDYVSPDTEFYVDSSIYGGVHLDVKKNLETLKYIADNSAGLYLMHHDDKQAISEIIKGTNIKFATPIE